MGSVLRSNDTLTYVIVTKAFLENLFSSFSLPLPDVFKTPGVSILSPNDTLPSGVSMEEVALVRWCVVLCAGISIFSVDLAVAWFEDDGMAHSFHTSMATLGKSGNGWVGAETVLIRLNNTFASSANFPIWSADPIEDASGFTQIGYDAVVCVEMYEP